LYAVLPVRAAELHVPAAWVGFLLSINRFARLFAGHALAVQIGRFGFKRTALTAAALAAFSTLLYGLAEGLVVWIMARLLWAFCFAVLRICAIHYALDAPQKGFGLGLSRSLQESGPLLALLIGPAILQHNSAAVAFYWLAALSGPALIFALFLPDETNTPRLGALSRQDKAMVGYHLSGILPSSFNFLVFISALLMEGLLVVLLGALCRGISFPGFDAAALAAFFLAFRRFSLILLSPLAGLVADRKGLEKTFLAALCAGVLSLLLVAQGFVLIGILGAFLSNSVSAALGPAGGLAASEERLSAIASNVAWRDLGAALGILAGGFFIVSEQLHLVFYFATFVLSAGIVLRLHFTKN
jgi:MFS transporter, DHA1 family, multidrug resistance protein